MEVENMQWLNLLLILLCPLMMLFCMKGMRKRKPSLKRRKPQ
ncbi:DUF2933 domain-containing protein [Bacillus paranthracis]